MSETYYRQITMSDETVLKLKEGVLHVNDKPLPGALTWIWDNLTLDPKPLDPKTNGEAGAERRKEEAKSIQQYRYWQKEEELLRGVNNSSNFKFREKEQSNGLMPNLGMLLNKNVIVDTSFTPPQIRGILNEIDYKQAHIIVINEMDKYAIPCSKILNIKEAF